jgi:DNA-binding transcriptional regulator LsrR (DeoR family)
MRNYTLIESEIVLAVCERFLAKQTAKQIAKGVNQDYTKKFTREDIYSIIREAFRRGYLKIDPPVHEKLRREICEKFGRSEKEIHVVSAREEPLGVTVPSYAADLVLDLIKDVGQRKECVHVGLGGGGTIMLVSQLLATALRSEPVLPKLAFHALSSGFDVNRPKTAPVSFFACFNDVSPDIEYIGFFGPAIVETRDYRRVKAQAGVRESYALAQEIDVVISSIAGSDDPHGELNQLLDTVETPDKKAIRELREVERVGDILYRPFTETGPVPEKNMKARSMSLFEIRELVKLAKEEHKHVVLVAGSCGICKKPKGKALRPLLERDSLKVWSHVVLNVDTALEVVAQIGAR